MKTFNPNFFIAAALFLVTACGSPAKEAGTEAAAPDASAAVAKRVNDFYAWYGANFEKAMAFEIVATPKDPGLGPYVIDLDAAEKELAFFKASGFMSEKYIQARRDFYKERAERFKKPGIVDGDPEGFTFDPFTRAQDGDGTVKELAKTQWKVKVDGKSAVAESGPVLESPGMKISLEEENGVWMITKVE